LIVVALIVIIAKLLVTIRLTPRAGLLTLGLLVICAAIPIGAWMVWTKFQFGDLTGSTEKIALLGWTRKPFEDWWWHPIFTPHGLWVFWSSLMKSFWRGEVTWHGRPLSWAPADGFFAILSLILLASAIAGLAWQSGLSIFQRHAIGIAILMCLAGIAFVALLSIQFDFGSSTGPSRAHPYFTAGRLLSGALIPFALSYVYGIAFLLRPLKSAVLSLTITAGLVAFIAVSEIATDHIVFASQHNWFHR
jgi:hypothetical protein